MRPIKVISRLARKPQAAKRLSPYRDIEPILPRRPIQQGSDEVISGDLLHQA